MTNTITNSTRKPGRHFAANSLKGSVVVHAPHFFPWPPMIARLAVAENVVFLDHMPFKKEYFQHRTKLLGPNGLFWAGLPIKRATKGRPVYKTEISDSAYFALSKIKSSIGQFYRKSPYYDNYFPAVSALLDDLANERPCLSVCSERSVSLFFDLCGVKQPKFHNSHEFRDTPADRSKMVLYLSQEVNAHTVLNGFGGSKKVHNSKMIESAGISMAFMDRSIFGTYPEGLSYLHYLFNEGPNHFQSLFSKVRSDYDRSG